MAYVATHTARQSGFVIGLTKLAKAIGTEIKNRRVYKSTYRELSALSAHELDDLGINRGDIARIAFEAAYGK